MNLFALKKAIQNFSVKSLGKEKISLMWKKESQKASPSLHLPLTAQCLQDTLPMLIKEIQSSLYNNIG